MKTEYIEFQLILGNGDPCKVRYCDQWGSLMFGKRVIHFEFLDCLSISPTKYRSEFRIVGEQERIAPEETAREIIDGLTGIKFSGEDIQMKLI